MTTAFTFSYLSRKFISIFLILLSSSVFAQWTQKADYGGGWRYESFGFSINGKGYIGGGKGLGGAKYDFWEFDPGTNTWTQKANVGDGQTGVAAGFSIGSKGYVVSASTSDFWEYDPVTNTWTRKADFPGVARGLAVGFSISNKGYFGTGALFLGSYLKDFWEYDPATDSWEQKPDLPGLARWFSTGFSVGNKGYIGTGNGNVDLKDFWEYDPSANTWTQKADFGGTARYAPVGFSIGDKGYIGTGYAGGFTSDFWEYDQATDSWLQKEDIPAAGRFSGTGFSIGTKGYIGTGIQAKSDFWEYSTCVPATVSAGEDKTLYFGYLPQQCVSITATVNGGTAPYSYQWTLDRPLLQDVGNADGDESMSNVNSQTVTICLLDTANLCVTVTDASGCSYTDCVTIYASDVRCFAGNSGNVKVAMCHNGNIICVDENAVAAHLAHGDNVGPCVSNRANTGRGEAEQSLKTGFAIYPNPNKGDLLISMDLHDDDIKEATIHIMNINGQLIKQVNVNNQRRVNVRLKESGLYFIKLITKKQVYTKKITVIR
jgi:hypothetical protein